MKPRKINSHGGSPFKEFLQKQGKSQSTLAHYGRYLLDFIAYLDKDNTEAENATAKEVLAYLAILQKRGYENSTRAIRLNVIKLFFDYQVSENERQENPVKHLKIRGTKVQKLHAILSTGELEALYHSYTIPTDQDKNSNRNWFAGSKLTKTRNKVILALFIHQGITTAEAEKLELEDLKLKEGQIYIGGSRKSNERTIDLKPQQIMELMEYIYQVRPLFVQQQENTATKRLFLSMPNASTSKATDSLQIWKSFTKELQKQNPKFTNFKQLRASVITHWLKVYNLREVQSRAGHRYVSSTEKYLVNQIDELQTDIDSFHPF